MSNHFPNHGPFCPGCAEEQAEQERIELAVAQGAPEGAWIVEVYRKIDGQTYLYQFENEPTKDQINALVEEDDLVEVKYANRIHA